MTRELMEMDRRSEFDIDEVLWELEFLDSDGVDAEFAAILIASGFGDRIVSATDPRPSDGFAQLSVSSPRRPRRPRRDEDRRRLTSRIRSPPSRQ